MGANKEQIMGTVQADAGSLAAELGMHREDEVTSLREDESVMIVTVEGVITGNVNVMYGEMSATRYKYFYLNKELLFEEQYNLSETGWETEPTVTRKLSKDAVLYKK